MRLPYFEDDKNRGLYQYDQEKGIYYKRGTITVAETTLDNWMTHFSGRRVGNSTRLVDHAIQLLFEDKLVIILDHHEGGTNKYSNQMLFRMVLKRLDLEHNRALNGGEIQVNKNNLTIQLIAKQYHG